MKRNRDSSGHPRDGPGDDPFPASDLAPTRRVSAWRISASFAVLTLLPLAVLTVAAFTLSGDAVDQQVRATVQASAKLEAQVVSVRMNGIRELVASFARRTGVVTALGDGNAEGPDLPGLQTALDEVLKADQGFGFASVLDVAGRLIAVSPLSPSIIGQDLSNRDYYLGAIRTGAPYVSEAYQTDAAQRPMVVGVAAAIRASGGHDAPVIGYLNVGYTLDAIQHYVEEFEQGQAVSLTVTDQRGVVLASPAHIAGLVSAAGDPRVRRALAGETATATVDEQSGAVLSGFAPVNDIGWTVHADVPRSAALASVGHLRRTVGLVAAGLAVALVVGSVLVGRAWWARARAEQRERAAARYARSLIEASLDPLVTISPEGEITDVNEAVVEVTGVERDRLVGTNFTQYFTEPDKAREGYLRVFADGSVTDYPLTIRHADGSLTDVLYNASVYKDTVGNVLGVLAAARDITERKLAEQKLFESEERYRGLVESQQELIIRVDRIGRYTFANDAYCAKYGLDREAILGTSNLQSVVHPDDEFAAKEALKRLDQPPYRSYVEVRTFAVDGERWVGWEDYAIRDAAGKIVEFQAVGRDIDDRKRAEAELLRKTQELEMLNADLDRSNDELEQFAYVASHDLSEPLRAISGPISLVAKRYHGRLDPEADQFIEFAVDGCRRMQQLIDGLLAYSRVGRVEEAVGPVDCNLVMKDVVAALGPAIEESGATVDIDQLPVVTGEANGLGQVLQNLVSNALKFARPGVAPAVSVQADRQGDEWRFTVRDNGIGIAPEHRDRIFGMFKRLHSREEYTGTGIGLALAKKIVERHGGRIGVEDIPSARGSRFWFTLPARQEDTP